MTEEKKEHQIFEVTQKVLLYRPDVKKFILFRDAGVGGQFHEKYGPWDVVGGRIDTEEDAEAGLQREVVEEAGKDIEYDIEGTVGRFQMHYPRGDVMAIGFLAIYKGGEIVLSDEHTELRLATAEEIENDSEIKPWLKQFAKAAAERLKEKEYLNDLKRLQADFENYKKRQAESQKDLKGILIERLVLDIVPVLDNFRSATQHVPSEQKDSPWVVGIQYIEKQLETVLADNGIQMIEAKEGEAFDPSVHEAVSKAESPEPVEGAEEGEAEGGEPVEPKGHVIAKVVQKGYKFGERVIRPAKVIVR